MSQATSVTVIVSGEIESADMLGVENVFCEYSFVFGPDWKLADEHRQVVSQLSKKVRGR
jgi:hypothetical protein